MALNPEGSTLSHQEQFFNRFRSEVSALQKQIESLESGSLVGGERQDATEHCLASIAGLQREVQDAASYTTTYDQRVYSEGIKALHEKLNATRAAVAPKPKFAFKSQLLKKNNSAPSEHRYAAAIPASVKAVPSQPDGPTDFGSPSGLPQAIDAKGTDVPSEGRGGPAAVDMSSRTGAHIVLPPAVAREAATASLLRLQRCAVDLSASASGGTAYANLTVQHVDRSLLICGRVQGSAHVTAVRDSVLLVTARQLRLHECRNCTIYLHVSSAPIIEDCSAMRFADLPSHFSDAAGTQRGDNQWRHVQDFKWLRSEPNPHWGFLSVEQYVSNEAWEKIASAGAEMPLDDMLQLAGVPAAET